MDNQTKVLLMIRDVAFIESVAIALGKYHGQLNENGEHENIDELTFTLVSDLDYEREKFEVVERLYPQIWAQMVALINDVNAEMWRDNAGIKKDIKTRIVAFTNNIFHMRQILFDHNLANQTEITNEDLE